MASWFVRYGGRAPTILTTAGDLASVVYRPLAAWFVGAAILSLQVVALVVLVAAPTTAGLVAFVAFFGAGCGAITPARAALVAELYGAIAYGTIGGVLALFVTLARAAGPVAAVALRDLRGGYEPVLWLLAAVAAAAAAAALRIDGDRPDRRSTEG